MDEYEFRAKQIEWDRKSLDKRVERWKQIVPSTYDIPLPELVWGYLSMADEMYIAGYFAGAIIISTAITELILADQVKTKAKMTSTEVERFGLEQLIILAKRLTILNDKETSGLNELRKLRNYLIHGKVGKLGQMAKKRYTVSGSDNSFLDAEFYVSSGFEGGIDCDTLLHLGIVRDLTVKLYGGK